MKRLLPVILLVIIAGAYVAYRIYMARRPFEWAGTVEAREITVGSRTGGRVARLLVQEGDQATAGQPLLELERGDLDAQRTAAVAQLEQARAENDKLRAGSRPEEIEQAQARAAQANAALEETRRGTRAEEIAAGEARLAQTQAVVDNAQRDADRARRLVATGAIPIAEADTAETALRTAVAQRDAQRQVVDQLRAGARSEEKAQAAARAAEAQAAAKLVVAGARVEDLLAAAARVEALDLRPGDLLAPNAPAATLLEDDQLYVRLYVPETQIGRIQLGQLVPITVDSFDRSFQGRVEHINAQGEYTPRNLQTADERADQVFAARIALVEGKDLLRAGMAATVKVPR